MAIKENTEMFVRADNKRAHIVVIVAIAVVCVIITIALVLLIGYGAIIPGALIFFFCAILSWFVYNHSKMEFEYSLMAGVLQISRITNQTKRKVMVCVDAKEITEFGKIEKFDKATEVRKAVEGEYTVVNCCGDTEESHTYFFKYKDQKHGMTKVFFTPNDVFLDALRLKSSEVMRVVRKL